MSGRKPHRGQQLFAERMRTQNEAARRESFLRPPRGPELLRHSCHRCHRFASDDVLELTGIGFLEEGGDADMRYVHRGMCPPVLVVTA